jgi:hypothetical protein
VSNGADGIAILGSAERLETRMLTASVMEATTQGFAGFLYSGIGAGPEHG